LQGNSRTEYRFRFKNIIRKVLAGHVIDVQRRNGIDLEEMIIPK